MRNQVINKVVETISEEVGNFGPASVRDYTETVLGSNFFYEGPSVSSYELSKVEEKEVVKRICKKFGETY